MEPEDESNDLDLTGLDTKIWLVKVPKFLAEAWSKVKEEGLELGRVRIQNRPRTQILSSSSRAAGGTQISLLLPDIPDTQDIPKEYDLTVTNNQVQNTYVFTDNDEGSTELTGTVHHECTVTPVINDEYRKIMRKRQQMSSRPQRTVQLVSPSISRSSLFAPGARQAAADSTGFGGLIHKKPRATTTEMKSTRMPRGELLDLLFSAFEKYPYWSFKGIVEYTKQPMAYLKEVLNEICIFNKRGPYTSMYELKPEYRRHGTSTTTKNENPEISSGDQATKGNVSSNNRIEVYDAEEDDDDIDLDDMEEDVDDDFEQIDG